MTGRRATGAYRGAAPLRVGLFGHLGACNIGNDASMEAVLRYLEANFPDAIVDAMCPGPAEIKKQYGIHAIPMLWYQKYDRRAQGSAAIALKALGRIIDAARIALWVRRHSAIVVPGAGVLEASLPLWPWGMPYAMSVLSASGKIFGVKVALVSVGAGDINKRITRWLSNSAARFAFYRSYRDAGARDAMRRRGLDTSRDPVYTDLAFALPIPSSDDNDNADAATVGVGVMAYYGSNDERRRAEEIYSNYVRTLKTFVGWLIDNGSKVRLFVGDTNGSDDRVVKEIIDYIEKTYPDIDPCSIDAEPVVSFADVARAMERCGTVIATRYHNVVCALKLGKPTISISYSPKHDVLMAEMGLEGFSVDVHKLNADSLIRLFDEISGRSAELRQITAERNLVASQLVERQFQELTAVLLPATAYAFPRRGWALGSSSAKGMER